MDDGTEHTLRQLAQIVQSPPPRGDEDTPASGMAAASAVKGSAEAVTEGLRLLISELHHQKVILQQECEAVESVSLAAIDDLIKRSRDIEDKVKSFSRMAQALKRQITNLHDVVIAGKD